MMRETYTKWALSTKVEGKHGWRRLLGWLSWGWERKWDARNMEKGLRLFHTREDARDAQRSCYHEKTRIEKVRVTAETI